MTLTTLTPEEKVALATLLETPIFKLASSIVVDSMQPEPLVLMNMVPHQAAVKAAQLSGARDFTNRLRGLLEEVSQPTLNLEVSEEWEDIPETQPETELDHE